MRTQKLLPLHKPLIPFLMQGVLILVLFGFLSACKKRDEPDNSSKSINAIALSRNSILVDRTNYWWNQLGNNGNSSADTIRLLANVTYRASVVFYHIEQGDTTNLSYEFFTPSNEYSVLWAPSDTAAFKVDFKSQNSTGSEAFLYPSEKRGLHALSLKLLHQADPSNPANPGGDSIVACTFPVIIE